MLFNIFDTIGRNLGTKINCGVAATGAIGILRAAFIVTTTVIGLGYLDNDALRLINLILFAFSNGFISTRASILAPGMVPDSQKEQIGVSNFMFLAGGLFSGCVIAVFYGKIFYNYDDHEHDV